MMDLVKDSGVHHEGHQVNGDSLAMNGNKVDGDYCVNNAAAAAASAIDRPVTNGTKRAVDVVGDGDVPLASPQKLAKLDSVDGGDLMAAPRRSTRKKGETSYVEPSDVFFYDENAHDDESAAGTGSRGDHACNGDALTLDRNEITDHPPDGHTEDAEEEFNEVTAPVSVMPEPKELSESQLQLQWQLISQLQAKLRLQEMSLSLLKQVKAAQDSAKRPTVGPITPATASTTEPARVLVQTVAQSSADVAKKALPPPVSTAPAILPTSTSSDVQNNLMQLIASFGDSGHNKSIKAAVTATPSLPPKTETSAAERIKQQAVATKQAKANLHRQLEQTVTKFQALTPPAPELHFVPNPTNSEFICLVGLEECVSHMLGVDSSQMPTSKPLKCSQCQTDFTPTWKWDKSGGKSVRVVCESCVQCNVKRMVKTEQDYRLASTLSRALRQERDIMHNSSGGAISIGGPVHTVIGEKRPASARSDSPRMANVAKSLNLDSSIDLALSNLSPSLTIMPVNPEPPVRPASRKSAAKTPTLSQQTGSSNGGSRRATPSPRIPTPDVGLSSNLIASLQQLNNLPPSWQQSLAQMVKSATPTTSVGDLTSSLLGKATADLQNICPLPNKVAAPSPALGPTPAKRGRGRNSPATGAKSGGNGAIGNGSISSPSNLPRSGPAQLSMADILALQQTPQMSSQQQQQQQHHQQQQMLLASLLASTSPALQNGDTGRGRPTSSVGSPKLPTGGVKAPASTNDVNSSIGQLMAMAQQIASMDSHKGSGAKASAGHIGGKRSGSKGAASANIPSSVAQSFYANASLSQQLALAMQQQQQNQVNHRQSKKGSVVNQSLLQQEALLASLLGGGAPKQPVQPTLDPGLLSSAMAGVLAGGNQTKGLSPSAMNNLFNPPGLSLGPSQAGSPLPASTAPGSKSGSAGPSSSQAAIEQLQRQALLDLMSVTSGAGGIQPTSATYGSGLDAASVKQLASLFSSSPGLVSDHHVNGLVSNMCGRNGDISTKLKHGVNNHRR